MILFFFSILLLIISIVVVVVVVVVHSFRCRYGINRPNSRLQLSSPPDMLGENSFSPDMSLKKIFLKKNIFT